LIHHVYGQTARCWFDEAKKNYKTISISELYKQIMQSKKYKKFSSDQKLAMGKIGQLIEKNRKKYMKKLMTFADKYYAHNEARTDGQRRKEYENLKVFWKNITTLIETAKNITNELYGFWQKKGLYFGEQNYQYFCDGFWETIDSKVLKLRSEHRLS